MIRKTYTHDSEETSDLRLSITREGYILLLLSFVVSLVGILNGSPFLFIPGLSIQLSYLGITIKPDKGEAIPNCICPD